MNRRRFLTQSCACGTLLFAGNSGSSAEADASAPKPAKDTLTVPVNPQQVAAVLSQIDASGDPALIDAVFTRWGNECFEKRKGVKENAARQKADFPSYVAYINSGKTRYWERLDYDETAGVLHVVGRKQSRCVCAYSECAQPAKALCTHCCKSFQKRFFEAVTGRRAEIHIDESVLLGGERCVTTIHLHEKLPQGT